MIDSIQLFSLATKQADWLAIRQATIASNIANANSPGYQSRDVKPFAQLLEQPTAPFTMATTNARHIADFTDNSSSYVFANENNKEITHSGNNVSLEQELLKGSQVSHDMALNAAITKAFHRMVLAAVKL